MFLIKKTNDGKKHLFFKIDFFSQIEILLLNMLKLLKFQVIPSLFSDFCAKFLVFLC